MQSRKNVQNFLKIKGLNKVMGINVYDLIILKNHHWQIYKINKYIYKLNAYNFNYLQHMYVCMFPRCVIDPNQVKLKVNVALNLI